MDGGSRAAPGIHRVEHLGGEDAIDGMLGERMEGDDADQRALQRPNVVGDAIGDQVQHARVGEGDGVEGDAFAQDGDTGGVVGRLDVGHQAGLEALTQALLDGDEGRGRRSHVRTS